MDKQVFSPLCASFFQIRRFVFQGVSGLAIWAATIGSSYAEPLRTLPVLDRRAELKQASLVAGNWIVGIHIDAARNLRVPTLYGRFPRPWGDGKVCARATNINGQYTFFGEYRFDRQWAGQLVNLPYGEEFKDIVKNLNGNNSGVAIHKGNCNTISNEFIPALWNSKELPRLTKDGNLKLLINLNSQRSQQVFARGTINLENGQSIVSAADCAPFKDGGIAFNFRCEIEIPATVKGIMRFEVWQVQSGVVADPNIALIHLQPYQKPAQ